MHCGHKSNFITCRFLRRGENRSTRRKTSQSREENWEIQPLCYAESGNRIRATFLWGECSHHNATTALQNMLINICTLAFAPLCLKIVLLCFLPLWFLLFVWRWEGLAYRLSGLFFMRPNIYAPIKSKFQHYPSSLANPRPFDYFEPICGSVPRLSTEVFRIVIKQQWTVKERKNTFEWKTVLAN